MTYAIVRRISSAKSVLEIKLEPVGFTGYGAARSRRAETRHTTSWLFFHFCLD